MKSTSIQIITTVIHTGMNEQTSLLNAAGKQSNLPQDTKHG
jgi:hypothetical protein